jgi:hypothetical protein
LKNPSPQWYQDHWGLLFAGIANPMNRLKPSTAIEKTMGDVLRNPPIPTPVNPAHPEKYKPLNLKEYYLSNQQLNDL